MPRITVPAADAIIDQPIKCLNHGHVTLKDYLGGDAMIVKSARVSYGLGTKTESEDKGLINYLIRNRHTSPFEQVVLTFHAKMPIFVARQMVRHRMARLNEISGRYTQMKDEFYIPEVDQVRLQSKVNKQGSEGQVDEATADYVRKRMAQEQTEAYEKYEGYISRGVAKELARIDLPLSLYTEWYWQMDLNNLFKFLGLRMDSHAQYEIRVYANAMYELAKSVAPWACEAFEEHVWGAKTFSKKEWEILKDAHKGFAIMFEFSGDYLDSKLGKTGAADFIKKVQQ